MDATLVTAHSEKEGAAPAFRKGFGFHPLGAWLASTAGCLAMLLRPGNAGPDTVADHIQVLAAAIAQIPARFRSRLLVRVDGAGASHELVEHLLSGGSGWWSGCPSREPIGVTIALAGPRAPARGAGQPVSGRHSRIA